MTQVQYVFNMILRLFSFLLLDIDECLSELHNCDDNAYCNNTIGSFNCTCNQGYEGSGVNCTGTIYFNEQNISWISFYQNRLSHFFKAESFLRRAFFIFPLIWSQDSIVVWIAKWVMCLSHKSMKKKVLLAISIKLHIDLSSY